MRDGRDYFMVDGRSKRWGLKIRKGFNTEKASLDYARKIEDEISSKGASVASNVVYQNTDIEKLIERLKPFDTTLNDVVAAFIRDAEKNFKAALIPPIKDLTKVWESEKTKNKLVPVSHRTTIEYKSYEKFIRHSLGTFQPADVTRKQLEKILSGVNAGQLTVKKYLQYFKNFFNWCIGHNYTSTNPTKGIKVSIPKREVVIYSPVQVETLLRFVEEKHPSMLGYYCLCVFGGLRPSEAQRVEWADLNFSGKEIFVKEDGKTGLRRFVLKDTSTLWVWLEHIKATMPDVPLNPISNHIGLQRDIRRECGLSWSQDVLRHSFGTYYYRLIRDLNQVSFDMGNSVVVCKKHYVKHCEQSSMERFWALHPKA